MEIRRPTVVSVDASRSVISMSWVETAIVYPSTEQLHRIIILSIPKGGRTKLLNNNQGKIYVLTSLTGLPPPP